MNATPIRSLSMCMIALVCACGPIACKRADGDRAPGTATSMQDSASKTGQALDDTAVTAKVKTKLAAEKDVPATQVTVATNQGKVTLTGNVPAAQISHIEQLVRSVDGVRDVDNQLKPAGPAS